MKGLDSCQCLPPPSYASVTHHDPNQSGNQAANQKGDALQNVGDLLKRERRTINDVPPFALLPGRCPPLSALLLLYGRTSFIVSIKHRGIFMSTKRLSSVKRVRGDKEGFWEMGRAVDPKMKREKNGLS